MRTHVVTYTVTVTEEEFETLQQISKRVFFYNYSGPESRLERCDSLRDKGLLSEDGNGRVQLTHQGVAFLNKENKKAK